MVPDQRLSLTCVQTCVHICVQTCVHLAGNLLPQVSHSFCKVLDQLQSLFDVWLCSMQVSHSCTSPKFSEKDEFALVRVHSIKLHMYASDANMRLCFRVVNGFAACNP